MKPFNLKSKSIFIILDKPLMNPHLVNNFDFWYRIFFLNFFHSKQKIISLNEFFFFLSMSLKFNSCRIDFWTSLKWNTIFYQHFHTISASLLPKITIMNNEDRQKLQIEMIS